MLEDKMSKALNKQVNEELYSSYLYLSMAADLERKGFKGFAHWNKIQAQEELAHGIKLYNFILTRGAIVELAEIRKPPKEWESPLKVFENILSHEQTVTRLINELTTIAIDLKDHATNSFLQWFVNEQVEEEANATEIRDKLKIAGSDGNTLLMLDKELSTRVFVNPLTPASAAN